MKLSDYPDHEIGDGERQRMRYVMALVLGNGEPGIIETQRLIVREQHRLMTLGKWIIGLLGTIASGVAVMVVELFR